MSAVAFPRNTITTARNRSVALISAASAQPCEGYAHHGQACKNSSVSHAQRYQLSESLPSHGYGFTAVQVIEHVGEAAFAVLRSAVTPVPGSHVSPASTRALPQASIRQPPLQPSLSLFPPSSHSSVTVLV